MNISDELNAAVDLIEADGWTQGPHGMAVGGAHCVLGALAAVAGAHIHTRGGLGFPTYAYPHPMQPHYVAARAVGDHLGVKPCNNEGIYRWNDDDERTAVEVIAALRATAVIAAAREVDVLVVTS